MKFISLEGREVRRELKASHYPIRSRENSRSYGQYHLGVVLQRVYKQTIILEEFSIPDSRLSFDFFIPSRKVAFEFQGTQHGTYNAFFHTTEADFRRQVERDHNKRKWCQINDITLIEIHDDCIDDDQLRQAIIKARNEERSC